jgi:hypothetical protein
MTGTRIKDGSPEESVLVYDHVAGGAELHIDRGPNEENESYHRRLALYGGLFGRLSQEG